MIRETEDNSIWSIVLSESDLFVCLYVFTEFVTADSLWRCFRANKLNLQLNHDVMCKSTLTFLRDLIFTLILVLVWRSNNIVSILPGRFLTASPLCKYIT